MKKIVMNVNHGLDNVNRWKYYLHVRCGPTHDNSSVTGSPVATGSRAASHNLPLSQAAGDSSTLERPLPFPATETQAVVPQRPVTLDVFKRGMSVMLRQAPQPDVDQASSDLPLGKSPITRNFNMVNSSENPYRSHIAAPGQSKPDRGFYPHQRYGILWTVCGWCGEELDAHLSSPSKDGEVSHGCCKPCFRKVMGFEYTPVVLLVPYCLMAFGMLKELICG